MSVELAFHLGPDVPEADTLAAIEALKINIPRLSEAELVRDAFNHFNTGWGKEKRLAEAVVGDFKDEDERRAWIETRCIELLRARISVIHPQLAELAAKTTSRTVNLTL